ncbi:MAG: hypothetical protein WA919_11205 [Coleofasciculaceae cyanobacterium]
MTIVFSQPSATNFDEDYRKLRLSLDVLLLLNGATITQDVVGEYTYSSQGYYKSLS